MSTSPFAGGLFLLALGLFVFAFRSQPGPLTGESANSLSLPAFRLRLQIRRPEKPGSTHLIGSTARFPGDRSYRQEECLSFFPVPGAWVVGIIQNNFLGGLAALPLG